MIVDSRQEVLAIQNRLMLFRYIARNLSAKEQRTARDFSKEEQHLDQL
jgi:hypothetical protein